MPGNYVLIPCFLGQIRPRKSVIVANVKFPVPHPLPSGKLKKIHEITTSSISPYSQHFISPLPTFSPRFLLSPYFFWPFLPPPYTVPPPSTRNNVGCYKQMQDFCNEIEHSWSEFFLKQSSILHRLRIKWTEEKNNYYIAVGIQRKSDM